MIKTLPSKKKKVAKINRRQALLSLSALCLPSCSDKPIAQSAPSLDGKCNDVNLKNKFVYFEDILTKSFNKEDVQKNTIDAFNKNKTLSFRKSNTTYELDLGNIESYLKPSGKISIDGNGAKILTNGWYIDFVDSHLKEIEINNLHLEIKDPSAVNGGNLLTVLNSSSPKLTGNTFKGAPRTLVQLQYGNGKPYITGNQFLNSGLDRYTTQGGVNIGGGLFVVDREVGYISDNTFDNIWQIAIFIFNTQDRFMEGGVIKGNSVNLCYDNGIRIQPNGVNQTKNIGKCKIIQNTVNDAHIDAIRSNGIGHTVESNTITSSSGVTNYGIKIDYGENQSIKSNTIKEVKVGCGLRLELEGAFAKSIFFNSNNIQSTGFSCVSHSALHQNAYFEKIYHGYESYSGGVRAINIGGATNLLSKQITIEGIVGVAKSQYGIACANVRSLSIIKSEVQAFGNFYPIYLTNILKGVLSELILTSNATGGAAITGASDGIVASNSHSNNDAGASTIVDVSTGTNYILGNNT